MGNMVDYNFYKNKRVLVIGDTGFKGSWLSYWLSKMGAGVYGYALPPTKQISHYSLLSLDKIIEHENGDIRDSESLLKVFNKVKPEIVFHLAAQALVSKSYIDPKNTFEINIMGSVNVLEVVKKSNTVKSLVYVTSDKCYENKEWIWGYRENDELGGYDPYSASKASAEIIFSSYKNSFFNDKREIGLASVRAGNVIGGGDWSVDRIIPDCINFLKNNEKIILRNPEATRPWQHVLEPLSGYLMLGKELYNDPCFSGSWNFGPNIKSIKTVEEVANLIIKIYGSGNIKYKEKSITYHESTLLQLNCDKANSLLKWYPQWSFKKTIKKTINWYQDYFKGHEPRKLIDQNIRDFISNY